MTSPLQFLQQHFEQAFGACGLAPSFGRVTRSDRPDLAQFQCNGALAAAKEAKANPRQVAEQVLAKAAHPDLKLDIAGPGFINITLADAKLALFTQGLTTDDGIGSLSGMEQTTLILDYGGPNVAKALHVGHMRTAIIGDTLRRLAKLKVTHVIGDVHFGDWGTPMGMVLLGLEERGIQVPDITMDLLAELYPTISAVCKTDPVMREKAKAKTVALQDKREPYYSTWKHIVKLSKDAVRVDYDALNVHFDEWLGESDVHDLIDPLVKRLQAEGVAVNSEGAVVIPMDDEKIPPLILYKSDGAVMYGTTDMATIVQRVNDFKADHIWYVVDQRQSQHLQQVFEGARKAGLLSKTTVEHLGFGTVNGPDGKPFKTRDGGLMSLRFMIDDVTAKAAAKLKQQSHSLSDDEIGVISRQVALATLRFADLSVHRTSDYIFDLEKFSSFEGKTGPYMQYTAVRIQSMLDKAATQGLKAGAIVAATTDAERELMLALIRLPEVVQLAFIERAPNVICDHTFELAQAYSRFYNDCHVLTEKDGAKQASWLALSAAVRMQLKILLDLLGIEIPVKM